MNRRRSWVYAAIACATMLALAWQSAEHLRVREAARETLVHRARDITSTVGLVIRSQRRWGGIVSKERIESALAELLKSGELLSVALLNSQGEIVASAGSPVDHTHSLNSQSGVTWSREHLTLANLVDLGSDVTTESDPPRRTIVVPFNSFGPQPNPNAGSGPGMPPAPPPGPPQASGEGGPRALHSDNAGGPSRPDPGAPPGEAGRTPGNARGDGPSNRQRGRPPFGRPPWMSEAEFRNLVARQGVHSFLVVMSTAPVWSTVQRDLWLRALIGLMACATAAAAAVSWRNLQRFSELELRLVKASEMNSHLREMNLAAAGLAHETRNPLNIIRGLAQLISKGSNTPPEVLQRSQAIVDEADRVTAQLNEFINYSRPRDVRPAPVRITSVVNEVARALTYDTEEKRIQIATPTADLTIEADEQLLRQALFNLLLNAIQAVAAEGRIEVDTLEADDGTAVLEVRDNGPGVPRERRREIFKPYFTTHAQGTGLGLAVVQQIVAAHGWEIECDDHAPRGAVFRIKRMRLLPAKS